MSGKTQHLINSLALEIEIDSEDEFKLIADRLSVFVTDRLHNEFNKLLDLIDDSEDHLIIIPEIIIDIGDIDIRNLEHQILQAVIYELGRHIKSVQRSLPAVRSQIKFETIGSSIKGEGPTKFEIQKIRGPHRLHLRKEKWMDEKIKLLVYGINDHRSMVIEQYLEHGYLPSNINLFDIEIKEVFEDHFSLITELRKQYKKLFKKELSLFDEIPEQYLEILTSTDSPKTLLDFREELIKSQKGRKPQEVKKIQEQKRSQEQKKIKITRAEIKQRVEHVKSFLKDPEKKKRFVQHASKDIIEALELGLYLSKEEIEVLLHPQRMDTIDQAIILLSGNEIPDWMTKSEKINDLFFQLYKRNPSSVRALFYSLLDQQQNQQAVKTLLLRIINILNKRSIYYLISSILSYGKAMHTFLNQIEGPIHGVPSIIKLNKQSHYLFLNYISKHKNLAQVSIKEFLLTHVELEKKTKKEKPVPKLKKRVYKNPMDLKIHTNLDLEGILLYFLKYGAIPSNNKQLILNTDDLALRLQDTSEISVSKILKVISFIHDNYLVRNNKFYLLGDDLYSYIFSNSGIKWLSSKENIEELFKAFLENIASPENLKYLQEEGKKQPQINTLLLSYVRFSTIIKRNLELGERILSHQDKASFMFFALKQYLNKESVNPTVLLLEFINKRTGSSPIQIASQFNKAIESGKIYKADEHIFISPISGSSRSDNLVINYNSDKLENDIAIKNAGLVLCWPFLTHYFNAVDLLTEKNDFKDLESRERAVFLLQYLAVKLSVAEEIYLPLNKVIAGFPMDQTISTGIEMTKKETDIGDALLIHMIKSWSALKEMKPDGLRGSFFIRSGILNKLSDGWKVTVERKGYDLLLDKLPWSLSMIRLPWTSYLIYVEWN